MSIAVMTNVWERSPSTGNELVVLLALADSADDDGKCWPSVQRLAAKARVHRATVFRLLASLRDSGEIDVERRLGQASVYRLAKYAVEAAGALEPVKSQSTTRRKRRPVAQRDPSQSATRRTGATIEPSVNNLVKDRQVQEPRDTREPSVSGESKDSPTGTPSKQAQLTAIQLMVEALGEARGYPIRTFKRHVLDAKALIEDGRSPEDVRRVVAHLLEKRRDFFVEQRNPLTMTTVRKYASVVLDSQQQRPAVRF